MTIKWLSTIEPNNNRPAIFISGENNIVMNKDCFKHFNINKVKIGLDIENRHLIVKEDVHEGQYLTFLDESNLLYFNKNLLDFLEENNISKGVYRGGWEGELLIFELKLEMYQ